MVVNFIYEASQLTIQPLHDVVPVSRDVNDEVLTSEIIVIGTVVDDDSAGHDSLEARGPSAHSAPSLTPSHCHCLFITDSDSNEREMLFIEYSGPNSVFLDCPIYNQITQIYCPGIE